AVTNLLEQHFGHLVDYGFTASMEEALDVIARGEGEAEKWLHSFYFGNGTSGLRELVSDEELAKIDPRAVSTIPIGTDDTEQEIGSKRKPKRASLFKDQSPESITLDDALQLLSLPRTVGMDAEGREIVASPGRFGPYLKRADGDTRSLSDEHQLLTISLPDA